MSLLRRGGIWYINLKWRDVPLMRRSTGTTVKARAQAMERSLRDLYDQGRLDLLGLLKLGRLTVRQLHHARVTSQAALAQLASTAASPTLGPLVEEWLAWLRSPAGISPRTKRRYAPKTVTRYRVSWEAFFEVLPNGRASRLADLNRGFLADFKRTRVRAQGGGGRKREARRDRPLAVGTVNRDLVALGCFLTWCEQQKELVVARPRLGLTKEPEGRERWLSAGELRALEATCRERWPEWWPLFAALTYTGMRYAEAAGLRGADIRLAERRISVNEADRRLKTTSSARDVPIPEPLAAALGQHLSRVRPGPADLVFPAPLSTYDRAYEVFRRVCVAAGIHDGEPGDELKRKRERKDERGLNPTATIHDLRHTFGVHAAQAGVPIVRLQKLLGHASPLMTMRYMKHAPEAYFAEDAARVAGSMGTDAEAEARADLARKGLRQNAG